MPNKARKIALIGELRAIRGNVGFNLRQAQEQGRRIVYTLYLTGLIGCAEMDRLRAWTYSWM